MTYQNYQFSVLTTADLNAAGMLGGDLGYGDSFTMPASASGTLNVADNDIQFQSDNQSNEQSDDWSGQTGSVTIDGVTTNGGGQFYMERVIFMRGSDGKTYKLAEIEVEGDAVGDLYSFVDGVPPAGVSLSYSHSSNYNDVEFYRFDAGPVTAPTGEICIEAEDMHLSGGFSVEHGSQASNGGLVRLDCGHDGKLTTHFGGADGKYDLCISAQDETDGVSKIMVYVEGQLVGTVMLDRQSDGGGSNNGSFSDFTLAGLDIDAGDKVELRAWRDSGEFVRIDKITFKPADPGFVDCTDPNAVKIDFEGFAAGTVIDNEYQGVTISAQRDRNNDSRNDAMIFDSANPTGGDTDLASSTQGGILIISEDNDSSDPDDAIGGTITFSFAAPAFIHDLKVFDTEEGGTITLTLADGSTQSFNIPNIADGAIDQVLMGVGNVVSMDVRLNGSGAIDDLCYVPGVIPGSLSGTYFCDENRDGLDNDGTFIAGVTVELLDASGNGTGITTTTDANGNYSFGNLAPGTYGVKFTDTVSGKTLIAPNANNNGNDDIDSDATDIGGGMSVINGITVVAGQDTPDNDAGVETLPGSLSGTYFCDENRDGLDNDGTFIAGVTVELLDASGNGTGITTTTDANGNYSFGNLAPGTYGVKFTDTVSGKTLIAPNANNNGNDDIDSDATDIGGGMSVINGITVVAGQDTPDNDAGVEPAPNTPPTPVDDVAAVCATDNVAIDVLANDPADADGDTVTVAHIEGQTVGAGGFVTLGSGATVTLNADGTVTYDSAGAIYDVNGVATTADDLLIGDMVMESFTYSVTDGNGGTGTATVDVTICGAQNTLETIRSSLPTGEICFQIENGYEPTLTDPEAYTILLSGTGDARFDGITFTAAYCLSGFENVVGVDAGVDITTAPILKGDLYLADGNTLPDDVLETTGINGLDADENLDLINWILNQEFQFVDNGDGNNTTFNDMEIQGAIWALTDGVIFGGLGTNENVQNILDLALANGEGFVAQEGDIVGLVINPTASAEAAGHFQPFIVGVEWDDLAEQCLCDTGGGGGVGLG